jgi:diaminohydroxyphosphoribosylaminopyrimidine deaminase / 5-amino-6-(5-phosphoribosylamino)uracil reductase
MSAMDEKYIRIAMGLAIRGTPSPNPYVGAVLVKGGKVVGCGWHVAAGEDHAEVMALESAGTRARGATLYTTLEPCNHFGRTPPCTRAIIEAGISRVVFGSPDPNPHVEGRGMQALKKAKIKVTGNILRKECDNINEMFLKYITEGVPFVTLKAAMSMDGRIATRTGQSRWITGETSREYAHMLRACHDAVLVGINTVRKDDPQLTARIPGAKRQPIKVILDSHLRTPLNSKILQGGNAIIACTTAAKSGKIAALERRGAKVIVCGRGAKVSLPVLLEKLGNMEITSVMVEGGGEAIAAFVEAGLFDKLYLFYAPLIIGGNRAKPAFGGEGAKTLASARRLRVESVQQTGEDRLFVCYPLK